MTYGEREIQQMITSAFRDSAANGNFTCASELFGYDPDDELEERYLIDSNSVPVSGPLAVVIYDLDKEEAWEIEINFTVRDVAAQPHYEKLFAAHHEQWGADHAV